MKFAAVSVIESLRGNPELCNFVLYNLLDENNTSISSGSNYLSLISGRQQHQQSFNDDIYSALILEESEKLYNKLAIKLTNEAIAAAAAIKESSLPLPLPII
ncbi:MAG TPA: hypothetical protein VE818_14295 [Nitrososphaeraceae archaeon]|nr:hypothetical protein [Nitrososphaeraceae archaeon]